MAARKALESITARTPNKKARHPWDGARNFTKKKRQQVTRDFNKSFFEVGDWTSLQSNQKEWDQEERRGYKVLKLSA